MTEEMIERRSVAARSRNQTFLVVFHQWDGDEGELQFMDEFKNEYQLDAAKRYWWGYGFTPIQEIDLWPGENKLQRTRRLRNNKWESWRQ